MRAGPLSEVSWARSDHLTCRCGRRVIERIVNERALIIATRWRFPHIERPPTAELGRQMTSRGPVTERTQGGAKCARCGARPATLLGVPMEASLQVRPDGAPLHYEMMFRIEPETWLRLCDLCVRELMEARALAAAFDLATWRDPRDSASLNGQ